MITQEAVDMIVESFELPPKIAWHARNRVNFLMRNEFVFSFEEAYKAVDKAVSEKVHDYSNPEGKFAPLLRLWYGKPLRVEPAVTETDDEEEIVPPNKISANQAIALMKEAGKEDASRVMQQLFTGERSGALIDVQLDELVERADEAAQRIAVISEMFSIGGRVVMPAREIVYIDFGRKKVKFRKRDFKGNPYQFYLDHLDSYAGLSRGQLSVVDSSLCEQLRKTGDLEKIPTIKREIGDPLKYMANNPKRYEGVTIGVMEDVDGGLYNALRRTGQAKAVPRKRRAIGDPLTYFKSHPEYKDLSRPDLAEKDWSLYVLLSRSRQLDLAIPENGGQK